MDSAFAGRVAVITGASGGIGRSMALILGKAGCRVGLIARRRSSLDEAVAAIRASGGTAASAVADVGDRARLRDAFDRLAAEHGPADLAIANAGVGVSTRLDPVNIEAVEETIRVNLMGVIYTIEAALPSMLGRRGGQIAAISSLAGYKGMPGESAYCASKAAVNAYLESLRVQVRGRGIAVSTICPGFVRTPMTAGNNFAMPFALDADQAAAKIVRALRRRAKVYNFPWQTTLMIKAARWCPDPILAYIFRGYLENPPISEAPARAGGGN